MKEKFAMKVKPALLLMVIIFAGCKPWGEYDNPADPNASNYQGFPTVSNPASIEPVNTSGTALIFTPTLISAKVLGADSYRFQIASDAAFTAIAHAVEIAVNKYVPTDCGVLPAGTYYWRVQAYKNGAWGPWATETATFSLQAPDAGTTVPADGATELDKTPAFDWSDMTGATTYRFQLSADSGFTTTLTDVSDLAVSQYSQATTLSYDSTYWWRVAAENSDGIRSLFSTAKSFALKFGIISGMTPADGSRISTTTPLLDWDDVPDATSYEVQLASTNADVPSATAIVVTTSSYQVIPALSSGDTRYWRVRAKSTDGTMYGPWSSTISFTESLLSSILIQGGTFQMGSTTGNSNEQPVHAVTVSSFYIGEYEVTQGQYKTVIGSNPSSFIGDDNRPVEQVTWFDAVNFCNALSDLEGLQRVYTVNGTTVTADWSKNGWRLPTEAEWEYAARGDGQSQGYTYSGSNDINAVAWYSGNSGSTTHPVGTKAVNEVGVYDMSGNVWEWCWDWYGSYSSGAQTDPTGASPGSYRVLRGGSCLNSAGDCPSSFRDNVNPVNRYGNFGFRVTRSAQ